MSVFSFEEQAFLQALRFKNYDPDIDDYEYWDAQEEYEVDEQDMQAEKADLVVEEWDKLADRAMLTWRKRALRVG